MPDKLFKKRKGERIARKSKEIKRRSETWLFVCEGSETEPNYIKSLIDYANSISSEPEIKIRICGKGRNTESLVKKADTIISQTEEYISLKDIPYAKTFIVFDKDDFSATQFNNAIKMAEARGYIPLWSNECFELWFILHYDFYDCDNGRNEYNTKLSDLLGVKYDKTDKIFERIYTPERLKAAIRNAKKLYNRDIDKLPANKKPCTNMFELIAAIEVHLKIDLQNPGFNQLD